MRCLFQIIQDRLNRINALLPERPDIRVALEFLHRLIALKTAELLLSGNANVMGQCPEIRIPGWT